MLHDDENCWYGCYQLQCGLSLSLSLYCMPSRIHWLYSAAILVTQLTTPYIRIAPAAGDSQLTGQTCSFLYILCPSQLFPPQLVFFFFTHYLFNVVAILITPSTGRQTWGLLHVCGFVYCLAICIGLVWLNQRLTGIVFHLHLLSVAQHERPAWGALFIWCVSAGDFWQELISFHKYFSLFFWD